MRVCLYSHFLSLIALNFQKVKLCIKTFLAGLTFQITQPSLLKAPPPVSLVKHKLSPLACVTDELSKAADTEVASHHRGERGFVCQSKYRSQSGAINHVAFLSAASHATSTQEQAK